MPLIMPDEQMPPSPLIVMIVGTPGSFKSSLSMTAKNAIHIDGDRGAKRAVRTCPTLSISSWDEVLNEEKAGTFKNFSTVIIDTPKSVIDDYMWAWSQKRQYFADDRKVYGKVGEEFKRFVSELRANNTDLIIVAHEKSREVGERVVYEPNITGQSKDLLIRMCDQVGFVEKREIRGANGTNILQSVITFYPAPSWPFCKNTGRLEEIIIPNFSDASWKNFFEEKVMTPTRDAIVAMSAEQQKSLDIVAEWRSAIDAIQDDGRDVDAELKAITKDIKEKVTQEHLQKQVLAYLVTHYKAIGWKYDSKLNGGVFVRKDAVTPAIKVDTAPVEAEKPAVAETPPPAETKSAEAAPVINANPHIAPPVEDLFAKRS